jgi:hypothetical protein
MKFRYFACLLLCSMTSSAFAGKEGGGGIGVRCLESSHSPKAFELLDLHEARLAGLSVPSNPQTVQDAIALTNDLLAAQLWTPEKFGLVDDFKEIVN